MNHSVNLWGLSLYVSIEKRKGAKEQMIVVSNFKFEDPPGSNTGDRGQGSRKKG